MESQKVNASSGNLCISVRPQSTSFTSLQINDSFNHYRSVSYIEAITGLSSSSSYKSGLDSFCPSNQQLDPKRKAFCSTPCTPRRIEIQKYSTLPPLNVHPLSGIARKSRSSSLSSFFKKLKPKFYKSSSDTKHPWIVIELSDHNKDCLSCDSSDKSDHSFELAAKSKEQHFTSLKDLNECETNACNCLTVADKARMKSNTSSNSNLLDVPNSDRKYSGKKTFQSNTHLAKQYRSDSSILFKLSSRKHFEDVKQALGDLRSGRHCSKHSSHHLLGSVENTRKSGVHIIVPGTKCSQNSSCIRQLENELRVSEHQKKLLSTQKDEALVSEILSTENNYSLLKPSSDIINILSCGADNRVKRAEPPRTLNLPNKTVGYDIEIEKICNKMTSMESIGDCSLDLFASASSDGLKNGTGTSECTLQSSNVLPFSNSSEENAQTPLTDNCMSLKENRTQERSHVINGCGQPARECTIAEIKLPSYVSISCAINGYTNYSKFCRSRDSSPARAAFRKSSLESYVVCEEGHKTADLSMNSSFKCTRSHSDCNGTVRGVFRETKQVTVSKQLQIPLKSTRKYVTAQEIMIGGDLSTDKKLNKSGIHAKLENEHLFDKYSLAQEVGNGGPKSLVQQRIESLYGNTELRETKSLSQRESRIDSSKAQKKVVVSTSKRSPSCPSQSLRKVNGSTPPVFRHLTKDFRRQLQGEIPESSNFKAPESSILVLDADKPKDIPEGCLENGEASSFSFIPNGESADECDHAPVAELNALCLKSSHLSSLSNGKLTYCDGEPGKAGHGFLEAMDVEKKAIQIEIQKLEAELKSVDIPEDASGKIRAACGKANLLLSQKFEQFKELCLKNINESPSVPFYTTASDLAGFWDMVMLQVSDVKVTFKDISAMKENNWEEICTPKSAPLPPKVKRYPKQSVSKSNPCTPKRSTKSAELALAREEARKQLMKAKKKGRQQNGNIDETEIAIFTSN